MKDHLKLTSKQEKTLKRLEEVLKQQNVRLTKGRLEILKIIIVKEHPTLNDIIAVLEETGHKVNVMSVYNTLDMLLDKHIIYANIFNGKQICYEPRVQESYHLKCDSCQEVHHIDHLGQFGEFFKSLTKSSEVVGWNCDHFKIEIHGTCPKCHEDLLKKNH
ncbi:Fur family peroxide stress response transcriptional regulator [Entomoplasma freundtii]|uniref:Fur family transcriptional regulator n=1 Tax=Entomoplasma freundtii TaxID=74700 RepID=A0A2K8NTV1_9MOLU|nr:transcriptional repressor [Entomoplasma freundtii]ATZ16608.1 Fur family transcriptional regulator [Entomoplasma freundtii]TDY58225.1 Fur family peroxide stress response transcriptional regulator [Entomoplasma freundtii]